jgi:hypothetical protein
MALLLHLANDGAVLSFSTFLSSQWNHGEVSLFLLFGQKGNILHLYGS